MEQQYAYGEMPVTGDGCIMGSKEMASSEVGENRAKKPKTGGRQKGTPNKLNADVKAMLLGALNQVGGQQYLAEQAKSSPAAFLSLIGKVLPLQITGEDGGPVKVQEVRIKFVDPE